MAQEIEPHVLTEEEARSLTERIKETLAVAHELIISAYTGRAWEALEYVSWDTYCKSEFEGARMVRLPREQRQEIVSEMRAAGMSTRAIGSGLGVDHKTVVNDLRGGESSPPDVVTGTDGKQYTLPEEPEVVEAEIVDEEPPARAPRTDVVGTMATLMRRTSEAARLAQKIKPQHIRSNSDAAEMWLRTLAPDIRELAEFLTMLEKNQ